MTPRNIRRAAERQAAKQARKAQQKTAATAVAPVAASPAVLPIADAHLSAAATALGTHTSAINLMKTAFTVSTVLTPTADKAAAITPAKLAANQANAQLSSGPKTDSGKLISSMNALKTGLTGRTVLLPTDDKAAYDALLSGFTTKFNPTTSPERELTESIVDSHWRIKRILSLEFAIFAKGAVEFADEFPDLEPAARNQMILAETYLKYEKSIRNLNTQEARLQRRVAKDTLELRHLQAERLEREAATQAFLATRAQTAPAHPEPPATSQPNGGFVFSSDLEPTQAIADGPEFTTKLP